MRNFFKRLFPLYGALFSWTLFLSGPARASEGPLSINIVNEWFSKVHPELYRVRQSSSDMTVFPGEPVPHTNAQVNSFFDDPWKAPQKSDEWATRLEGATSVGGLLDLALDIESFSPAPRSDLPRFYLSRTERRKLETDPFFGPLREPLLQFFNEAGAAQRLLEEANADLNLNEQREILSLIELPEPETGSIKENFSSQKTKAQFALAEKWKRESFLMAAETLADAIDDLSDPLSQRSFLEESGTKRLRTPIGDIVFSFKTDPIQEEDLENVLLFVQGSTESVYRASPALAQTNQIRVVIDFAKKTIITPQDITDPGTAAGFFGLAVFIRPTEQGTTKVEGGSYAQGFGAGGMGLFLTQGPCELEGGRYVQGSAFFGIGALACANADQSSYWAERSSQGHGYVGGVGLFRHDGNDARVQGGLVHPDPREPQGAISLCQGVGSGRRAYAGGGVGIGVVSGDRVQVEGSYFAQGAGYWKGLGVFRFRGNESRLQARRYDFGTGVHHAFGHFQAFGNKNRYLNWGVGPAYGWDNSFGSAIVVGSDNEIQADWGSGTAMIGGYSAAYFKGDNNQFRLPEWGKGFHDRGLHSFTFHWLEGEGNKIEMEGKEWTGKNSLFLARNPWGFLRLPPIKIVKKLPLKEPVWPDLKRETPVQRETIALTERIKEAAQKARIETLADLVDVAAAFSLDKESPRKALGQLLLLKEEDQSLLIDILEPAAYEQRIQLLIALSGYGESVTRALLAKFSSYDERKRLSLMSVIANRPPSEAIPFLETLWNNKEIEPAIRLAALGSLGVLFNQDNGQETGLRQAMETTMALLEKEKAPKEEELALLGRLRHWGALSLLNWGGDLTDADRALYFNNMGEDVTSRIDLRSAQVFLDLMRSRKESAVQNLQLEENFLKEAEPRVEALLFEALKSTNPAAHLVALKALGRMRTTDALSILPFARHENAQVREEAAVALGRLGEPGAKACLDRFDEAENLEKRVLLAALPHAVTKDFLSLFKKGLKDADPLVRWTAIAAAQKPSAALEPSQKTIRRWVKAALKKGTPDEKASALFVR